jgi:hypothetical protein
MTTSTSDADLSIVSFPRSGRTWLAWQLASYFIRVYSLDVALDFHSLYRIVPGDGAPTEAHEAYLHRRIPRVRQLHVDSLPAGERFLLLFRDPRDAIASYYLHERWQLHLDVGDVGDYVRSRTSNWVSFMNAWGARLTEPLAASLSYEERLAAPTQTLQKVLQWTGVEIVEDHLLAAAEHSRFDAMLERELHGPRIPLHDYDPAEPDARRVRRGKPGGWRDVLSKADEAAVGSIVKAGASPAVQSLLRRTAWSD